MKRERRWIRLKFPSEEEAFAEFEEVLFAFSPGLVIPIKDAVLVARDFFGPVVRASLKRKKIEIEKLGEANQNRWQTAEQRKKTTLATAARLQIEQRLLRLPGKKSQLAARVWKEIGQPEKPSTRTIRRWIAEASAKRD
jgi:hypothetical protein